MKLFTFGGIDLTPYIDVTSFTRPVFPKRRIERTTVPGMDGELARLDGLEASEVIVTGYLTARALDDVSMLRRILAGMLSATEPQRLVVPDEPWSYLIAVYEGGAEPSRHSHRPKVELPFLCADPVAYGQHRKEEVSGTRYVDAGGTYRARPTIMVKPPSGSYWQITDAGSGKYIRVDASFTGSQTLVLDTALARCTVNGSAHAVNVGSDFETFYLEGQTQLKVSGGTATVEWDERWV